GFIDPSRKVSATMTQKQQPQSACSTEATSGPPEDADKAAPRGPEGSGVGPTEFDPVADVLPGMPTYAGPVRAPDAPPVRPQHDADGALSSIPDDLPLSPETRDSASPEPVTASSAPLPCLPAV